MQQVLRRPRGHDVGCGVRAYVRDAGGTWLFPRQQPTHLCSIQYSVCMCAAERGAEMLLLFLLRTPYSILRIETGRDRGLDRRGDARSAPRVSAVTPLPATRFLAFVTLDSCMDWPRAVPSVSSARLPMNRLGDILPATQISGVNKPA